jgi:hypothetical protein
MLVCILGLSIRVFGMDPQRLLSLTFAKKTPWTSRREGTKGQGQSRDRGRKPPGGRQTDTRSERDSPRPRYSLAAPVKEGMGRALGGAR